MEPNPNNYHGQGTHNAHISDCDDIDIYHDGEDDQSDQFDDDDEDDDQSVANLVMVPQLDSQGHQLPEDEPWPGIEDQMSDGENVDPRLADHMQEDEEGTDASSQPSEYPSTQMWNHHGSGDGAGFHIHEDTEAGPPP